MCAAVPPRLIHPSLNQNRKLSLKEGRCTLAESLIPLIPGPESNADASREDFFREFVTIMTL
jgi:hypothetical protein